MQEQADSTQLHQPALPALPSADYLLAAGNSFTREQQELIRKIFDSMHSAIVV
ncbi:MAG: hypothetical protein HY820_03495 [Acidobacteria bacterium]|nr:hypothetical protein [Acidobacteriota bacterium]